MWNVRIQSLVRDEAGEWDYDWDEVPVHVMKWTSDREEAEGVWRAVGGWAEERPERAMRGLRYANGVPFDELDERTDTEGRIILVELVRSMSGCWSATGYESFSEEPVGELQAC